MFKQRGKGCLILIVANAGHVVDPLHPLCIAVLHECWSCHRAKDTPGSRLSNCFRCV